jgi:hypothetical protein
LSGQASSRESGAQQQSRDQKKEFYLKIHWKKASSTLCMLLLHLHNATLSCNLLNLLQPPRPPSALYWLLECLFASTCQQ